MEENGPVPKKEIKITTKRDITPEEIRHIKEAKEAREHNEAVKQFGEFCRSEGKRKSEEVKHQKEEKLKSETKEEKEAKEALEVKQKLCYSEAFINLRRHVEEREMQRKAEVTIQENALRVKEFSTKEPVHFLDCGHCLKLPIEDFTDSEKIARTLDSRDIDNLDRCIESRKKH